MFTNTLLMYDHCLLASRQYSKPLRLVSITLVASFSLSILFLWNNTISGSSSTLFYPQSATSAEEDSSALYFLSLRQPEQPELRQKLLQQVSNNDTIIDNADTTTNSTIATSSPKGGIQIAYPKDWIVNDLGNGTVRFSTPLRTDLMRFTVNIVDLPTTLQKNMTLDKLVELNLNSSRQQLSNFSLVESNATTLSSENQSARKIVYTNTNKDPNFPLKFKTMQIFTIKDDQLYTISYVSEDSQYSRLLPTIENMIDSITFTKKIAMQTTENINNRLAPTVGLV